MKPEAGIVLAAGALRWFAGLALWLLSPLVLAQSATWNPGQAGEELEISLLTFGPGEIYWERFGHNAIGVRNSRSGEAWSYNYGIFDFAEENFFLNFLRGRMRYSMAANPLADDIAMYASDGRAVVEQALNLAPAQRLALNEFLSWNLRPENAKYSYEYFTANCSTRVRDALDQVLGGALRQQLSAPSRGYTYRLHADSLMAPEPGLMLPMDLGLGPFADKKLSFWDEGFVPMALMQHVSGVQISDDLGQRVPLVSATRHWHAAGPHLAKASDALFTRRGPYPLGYALPAGILGAALGLLLLLTGRRRSTFARNASAAARCILALVFGFAGIGLLALWGLTEHVSAWRNENLLLLNPLILLLIPGYWRARKPDARPRRSGRVVARLVLVLAAAAVCVKVLPWFTQYNAVWIALLLPLHLALAGSLLRNPRPSAYPKLR